MSVLRLCLPLCFTLLLCACGGSSGSPGSPAAATTITPTPTPLPPPIPVAPLLDDPLDIALFALVSDLQLLSDPIAGRDLPDIQEPMAQLGKSLFYSKSLSGEFDVACASCHHPLLAGADGLSLPVGTGVTDPDLLGPGRRDADALPDVPRHSPTIFNIGLWDKGLFYDSRVESLGAEAGANGANSPIRTPDSGFGNADANAGANLVAAQARFPVTIDSEMRSNFLGAFDDDALRAHLASRIGDYGNGAGELVVNSWLTEFQQATGESLDATQLISFETIAAALGEFQRSMIFVDNPWYEYLGGNLDAISAQQKRGATLFFTSVADGGGGCVNCHSGALFSDQLHHVVGFPQIGPGKGDGADQDLGRARETGNTADRFAFRTPSLLNVAATAPYGHSGAYADLTAVLNHYSNPNRAIRQYFDNSEWCNLPQFQGVSGCAQLYLGIREATNAALDQLGAERQIGASLFINTNLNNGQQQDIIAFLQALTDPCATDPACLAPWLVDASSGGPDNQQLNARFSASP